MAVIARYSIHQLALQYILSGTLSIKQSSSSFHRSMFWPFTNVPVISFPCSYHADRYLWFASTLKTFIARSNLIPANACSHPRAICEPHFHVAIIMNNKYRLHKRNREKHVCILFPALNAPNAIDSIRQIGQYKVFALYRYSGIAYPKDKVGESRFAWKNPGSVSLLVASNY